MSCKLQNKTIDLLLNESEIAMNEQRIDHIKALLLAINNGTKLEQKKALNDSIFKLNQSLDNLHSANVTLWHNSDQYRQAIDRYTHRLEEISKISISAADIQLKLESIFTEARLNRESMILDKKLEIFETSQKALYKESSALFKINLICFQKSLDLVSGVSNAQDIGNSISTFIECFAKEFLPELNSSQMEVSYDTCTEDCQSEATYPNAEEEDFTPKELPNEFTFPQGTSGSAKDMDIDATPVKKKVHMKDKTPSPVVMPDPDATPVQKRKSRSTPRNTPSRSTRKTPSRRKMRMSMIPVMRSIKGMEASDQLNGRILRSALRGHKEN